MGIRTITSTEKHLQKILVLFRTGTSKVEKKMVSEFRRQ